MGTIASLPSFAYETTREIYGPIRTFTSSRMGDLRLSRRHTGDRHPKRRAGDVVEPGHMEELDRLRIAAVLAADPELEPRMRLAPDPRRQAHEPPDARLVDGLER